MADSVLSKELLEELGSKGGGDLIVERKKKDKKEFLPPPLKKRKLTKKERLRLEKLAEKRKKAVNRKHILASIEANAITPDERALMMASGRRGQKKSKKQTLKDDLQRVNM
tara:strand:+ start:333 stop:665 length:333 start_codon:yes stop_codon:yes gene_type:complete